ncbi:hypothetical protein CI1B_29290 [Bradyrhizobium ivorense]|uniref:2,6-dihydroxypseudooxynicotine hydrolase n=1 Tax=Bradyrhizobium ivorense TaxID=2511166 RepID=A0A508T3T6_9BRAD|nr:acetylxylan esterase [Bradyrhizobium ivorense]VIO70055.1 hypothetical protein CI1B_29290 [Bradyrhizobium ivorense]
MEITALPFLMGQLASARQRAAVFLDNLDDIYATAARQDWVARWTDIGDSQYRLGDLKIRDCVADEAAEAWLCALTALEVARRLLDQDGTQAEDVSAKIAAVLQRFASSSDQKVERVEIACCDQPYVAAYFLRSGSPNSSGPTVICMSREGESASTMLGRLLPVVMGRGVSVLVLGHEDISTHYQTQVFLSSCLDYLSLRPEVDSRRIGVYGEGLSAVLATDFAASDERIAAAVCDGGLWKRARTLANIRWLTSNANTVNEANVLARRSHFVRRLRCPVLVVVGGCGTVSVSEAIELQAECLAARIDLELTMARIMRTPSGEIENFVSSDDSIFAWLEHKLTRNFVT